MITVCRAQERLRERHGKRDRWQTFHGSDHYGSLEVLDEEVLAPGCVVRLHALHHAEVITYVRDGTITHESSFGHAGLIHPGEWQLTATARDRRYGEANASSTRSVQIFQIALRSPSDALAPGQTQRRFWAGQRRGVWCAVASVDGRRGSLLLHQDATIYSALMSPGLHLVHELAVGRCAWLHVVLGAVVVMGIDLVAGDGVGIAGERAISVTATADAEVLLLDLDHIEVMDS